MFFFDLEAGGFLGSQSSILSIAYGKAGEELEDLYARPVEGSRVYEFSAENVWKPIQTKYGLRLETEEEILNKFIYKLESLDKGTTIAGWNIGYHATPAFAKEELRGFDLHMLATRALKYSGMSERLQNALRGLNIRDIGQEYAVIAARVALQNKEALDPAIYEQAVGFAKELYNFGIEDLSNTQAAAYTASTHRIQFRGWKQETMFEAMFDQKMVGAHEALEDVRGGKKLSKLTEDEIERRLTKNISFWNQSVLEQKAASAAKKALPPESYFTVAGGRLFDQKIFSNLGAKSWSFLKSHKVGLGIAAGVGALALLEPGRLFRDDAQEDVDFSNLLQKVEQTASELTSDKTAQEEFSFFRKMLNKYGQEVGTGHKRILMPQAVITEQELTDELGFVPVHIAIPESGETNIRSFRHPDYLYHIHEHDAMWSMHEDRHPSSTMLMLKSASVFEKAKHFIQGIPHIITEGVPGAVTYLAGRLTGTETMQEKVLEHTPLEYWSELARFSGKDDAYNTIEGLRHEGVAWQQRQVLTDFGSGWIGNAISNAWKGIQQGRLVRQARKAGKQVVFRDKEAFVIGPKLGKGGFGETFYSYSIMTGQRAIYKQAINPSLKGYQRDQAIFLGRTITNLREAAKAGIPSANEKTIRLKEVIANMVSLRTKDIFERGKFTNPLHYEAVMQSMAHEAAPDIVPKVLGTTKHGFLQVYEGGRGVKNTEALEAAKFLQEEYLPTMTSFRMPILHADPDISNMIRLPSGKFQIIDFGIAAPKTQFMQTLPFISAYKEMVEQSAAFAKMHMPAPPPIPKRVITSPVPPPLPRLKNQQQVLHKQAQKRATGNMQRPGKRHTKSAGSVIL